MMELFELYRWTFVAGCLASTVLALLGTHLATRDRAMQTLCVGQGAMVGVLLGLGFWGAVDSHSSTPIPFASALVLAALTFVLTDVLVAGRTASKNTTFALIFAVLVAAGHLVSAIFPALESHLAQVYFGDLATLSVRDSKATVVLSALALLILVLGRKTLARRSFEHAIFGQEAVRGWGDRAVAAGFFLLTLLVLSMSVQFVGFLFTVAMLFMPTGGLALLKTKGLRLHLVLAVVLAASSSAAGFLISLRITSLPTVPTIVGILFASLLTVLALERLALAVGSILNGLSVRLPHAQEARL